ncbi:MAG: hypothetical protein RMJ39_04435 [Deltaproteobacteria bacterium]|nr:hypothetical protein [Deltaproteobacteria bacterium]
MQNRSLDLLKLTAIVFFLFLETEIILVRVSPGKTIYYTSVKDGDTLELSHVNSIYEREVKEVLRVERGYIELSEVITDSYGVKEYYLLDNFETKRGWKVIRLRNTEERNFSLKIKDRSVGIEKYADMSIEIEIRRAFFAYGLFLILCYIWVH